MLDKPTDILWPVFGHLLLIQVLFLMVSIRRWQAVRAEDAQYSDLAWARQEPELSRRWAKNLDNQFQVPMLVYTLVALLFAVGQVTPGQIVLAWIFLAGRVLHTLVQVGGDNVQMRGIVFTINYVALSAMWLLFFYHMVTAS